MRLQLPARSVVMFALFVLAALALAGQGAGTTPRPTTPRPTVPLTEGPFYKPGSPERIDIAPAGAAGVHLTISGTVLDLKGRPLAGAWLDFWQADGSGRYDNVGFAFRGHQTADAAGQYRLVTVIPGEYPGRTPHIHVKLRAPGGSTVTTQIFFPGNAGNNSDPVFDRSLVVTMSPDDATGRIDFVIPGS
jgi:protocatechuate 3,4-dioxygenase beta subunit